MKNKTFLLIALLLIITSCSKASRINRKLQGTWIATTYDGIAVSSGFGYEVSFEKDASNTGSGKYEFTILTIPTGKVDFTYSLNDDKLTYIETVSQTSSVLTINTFTKDKLEWTDSAGKKTILEPK